MTINDRMFTLMKTRNIKATEMANHLNINKTVISAWKNRGTNPPAEYIVQICELLKVSTKYLLTGKEDEELTQTEQQILNAYRNAQPGIQDAVNKLLDVEIEQERSLNSRTG